ncbi:MAG: S8 family serine peptidase [bacterium]|nr:S8 family serine peptidase [bacterium]
MLKLLGRRAAAAFPILAVLLTVLPAATAAAAKIPVKTLDDLPRHTYEVPGTVSDLLRSDADFAAFAAKVGADVAADLEAYDITDPSTLQRLYGVQLTLALMNRDDERALALVELIRGLEDKEASRLTSGLAAVAIVRARRDAGGDTGAAYQAAFRSRLREQVAPLPWDLVRDRIVQQKGRTEILSENLVLGMVQAQLDPVAAASGGLSSDLAAQVVNLGYALRYALPLKDSMLEVYGDLVASREAVKQDIWEQRDARLDDGLGLAPVTIAIWDSGVDVPVFADAFVTNPGEKADGVDNDGNGFVDDIHGVAFDYDGRDSVELLYPLGEAAPRIGAAMDHMKGFMDIQSGLDSVEASALKTHIAGLAPAQVQGLLEDLSLCGLYAHGTHVAGIAVRGNPYARLLAARISFDWHTVPQLLTEEMVRRHAASYARTAAYFRDHGVRVVNMSWGWGLKEIEGILESNGWGASAEERSREAAKLLGILEQGLREAITGSPGILFVCAAGNDDNDVAFDVNIPASFTLPNLLVVGAVDQAGEPTGFTSSGDNVRVYANGFEVPSYVPGGRRMRMSGTSMAAPQACNLAAKLLARAPALTPVEVVELIGRGGDEKGAYLLMNPKSSLSLLDR